jgi:transposase
MTRYKRIGIDTSKAVFTVHGVDQQDRPVLGINLRRPQLASFFKRLLPTEIAMLLVPLHSGFDRLRVSGV